MKIDISVLPAPDFSSYENDDPRVYTKTQQMLISLVKKVLKVERCNLNSNFFHLGGDSLLALSFLSKINNEFGMEVTLATLYEKPILTDLALILDKQKHNASEAYRPAQGKVENCISCLKPGGDKPPLFTVYLDAANRYLPDLFPSEQPIYTFIPPGSNGEKIQYKSVERIAAFHIDSLLKIFPDTPVHLAGYSFGGLVAIEMAIQMQKRHIKYGTITLIDTLAPQAWQSLFNQAFFSFKFKDLISNQKRKLYQFTGQKVPVRQRNLYILLSWQKAIIRYFPETSGAEVVFTLIRSSESLSEEPGLGWEKLPGFIANMKIIEGDHRTIIRDKEKVSELAELLKIVMQ